MQVFILEETLFWLVKPDKNEIVKNAIQFIVNQFINNGIIEQKDILSSVDQFMINEKVKNTNVTDIIKTPKKSIIPRSEKQKIC